MPGRCFRVHLWFHRCGCWLCGGSGGTVPDLCKNLFKSVRDRAGYRLPVLILDRIGRQRHAFAMDITAVRAGNYALSGANLTGFRRWRLRGLLY